MNPPSGPDSRPPSDFEGDPPPVLRPARIRVGCCGFAYDDWRGVWYPPDVARDRMFEHYAARFDAVEIDSTYYRIPPPRTLASLARRAEGRLAFAVKLNGDLTHRGDLSEGTVRAMRAAVEPLAEAGRLEALLAQFPFRFHATPANREFLLRLRGAFPDLPIATEIRHDSWCDPEPRAWMRDRGIDLVTTDMPALRGLPPGGLEPIGSRPYVRFHGRNEAKWFVSDNATDPYDYRYSEEQLREWVEPIRALARRAATPAGEPRRTALVFFNNHARGQAPENAETLRAMLREKSPGRDATTGGRTPRRSPPPGVLPFGDGPFETAPRANP